MTSTPTLGYDQAALELCAACGWKAAIPDDGCLNCERGNLRIECASAHARADQHAETILWQAREIGQLLDKVEWLRSMVIKLHTAKGRYHTQIAACDLYDAVGLPNERPKK